MSPYSLAAIGGGKRIRTDDPLLVGQVLYQLSYTPVFAFLLKKAIYYRKYATFGGPAVITKQMLR